MTAQSTPGNEVPYRGLREKDKITLCVPVRQVFARIRHTAIVQKAMLLHGQS